MTKKRRLELLPEVLPKPHKDSGPSSVRARALARLSVLAALSAAQSCRDSNEGGGYGVVDPLPTPSGGTGGRRPPPSPGINREPWPEPSACFSLGTPAATASYVEGGPADVLDGGTPSTDADASDAGGDAGAGTDGGAIQPRIQVRVELDFTTQPTSVGHAVTRTGVSVLQSSISGLRVTLLLALPESETATGLILPVVCDGQTDRIHLDLQLDPSGIVVSAT